MQASTIGTLGDVESRAAASFGFDLNHGLQAMHG
jgi:hypothetical protein